MNQFVCVPLEVLKMKLSGGALKALLGLLSFRNHRTGQCNPRFTTLCERLGVAWNLRRKVYRWLAELRVAGVMTSRRERFAGVVSYEFPMFSIGVTGSHRIGDTGGAHGGPYPLYEQKKVNKGRIAPHSLPQKNLCNAPAVPRKPITSEVLEIYYAQERRKARR